MRKTGVAAVKQKQAAKQQFTNKGEGLEAVKLASVREMLDLFKGTLETFAQKHRAQINSDPEFRMQFHTMCLEVGVDPLASSKGFWAGVLGVGDYYFELGVKIVQISVKTRAANGGMVSLDDMLSMLRANISSSSNGSSSTSSVVSAEDVKRAVDKLSVLGGGFRIMSIGGRPFIISVPVELNRDHEELVEEAQKNEYVSERTFVECYGWTHERFSFAITPLLREGIVWVDEHEGTLTFYFPSLS